MKKQHTCQPNYSGILENDKNPESPHTQRGRDDLKVRRKLEGILNSDSGEEIEIVREKKKIPKSAAI